jgi:hypothetical protein
MDCSIKLYNSEENKYYTGLISSEDHNRVLNGNILHNELMNQFNILLFWVDQEFAWKDCQFNKIYDLLTFQNGL